jgi:hypothetical protein
MRHLALFLLLACGGTDVPATDADAPADAAPVEAPADEVAAAAPFEAPALEAGMDMCLGAVDCVAVQLSCCNGCDGGVVVAVNKTRAEEAKAKFGQKDCESVTCAGTECAEPAATCSGGCKLEGS